MRCASIDLAEAIKAVSEYLEIVGPEGGICHLVLGDLNVEDSNLEFCWNECRAEGDKKGMNAMQSLVFVSEELRERVIRSAAPPPRSFADRCRDLGLPIGGPA